MNQATRIVLEEVSGPGDLGGTTTAEIPRNGSGATISEAGVTYSRFGNGIKLRVRATSGVQLVPGEVTIDVALTAVDRGATEGVPFDLQDPGCGVGGAPTSTEPICGRLLTKGADGLVIMSVGSCEDLGPCRSDDGTTALVVTLIAKIEHPDPMDPYSTAILACDKDRCGGAGVPKLDVIYTFDNNDDLTETARECPGKGDLGTFDICIDYVQSTRSQGDLYLYVLFNHDLRYSG